MNLTIALLNPLAASGKTTLAINLAFSFALLEKRTLYVDCTSSGVGSQMLMGEGISPSCGVADVVSGCVSPRGAIVSGLTAYLDVIPASAGEKEAEAFLVFNPEKERVLNLSLRKPGRGYDIVIIDTPSGNGFFVKSALIASDLALVPLHPGWNGNSQLKEAGYCVEEVLKCVNPGLKGVGLVYMGPSAPALDETRMQFVGRLPDCDTIRKGMAIGTPAALVDVMSPGAQAFLDLAREMLEAETDP
ncbi:ParA family protein [Desulfoluna sp.]|uniref:ParA family protein n=1 Tax=Desulfoluna sp. TaxID=2045199 RepID=UPI002602922B|nr:ParA family protein [Desulfoluna sp.]